MPGGGAQLLLQTCVFHTVYYAGGETALSLLQRRSRSEASLISEIDILKWGLTLLALYFSSHIYIVGLCCAPRYLPLYDL